MENIKDLENEKLSLYYERTHANLNEIKMNILENISDTLGNVLDIDKHTCTDTKEFHKYCKRFWTIIQKENRDIFLTLSKNEQEIEKEMEKRQIQMLKEIGITMPSRRVQKIIDQTRGIYFTPFADMITWIKLARKKETYLRPEKKKIEMPMELMEFFEIRKTTIIDVLNKNLGPNPHPN